MNLMELLNRNDFQFKKVASTNGGEYAGACPFCGGTDRFRVWPFQGNNQGRYWCRQCGKRGDIIQFLIDFKGLCFKEAISYIYKEEHTNIIPISRQYAFKPKQIENPPDKWISKACGFIEFAHKKLLDNKDQQNFLFSRGLNFDSVLRFRLGWNPVDIYVSRTLWGLENNGKKLWIPSGIVIPLISEHKPVRIRIRRTADNPRYYILTGSSTRPMILGQSKTVTIVESELDGLLLHQEARDVTSVIALGSAQIKPDAEADKILNSSDLILGALDYDNAGKKAKLWWQKTYPAFRRWPVVTGKDPSEAFQNGMPIKLWIQAGINEALKIRAA